MGEQRHPKKYLDPYKRGFAQIYILAGTKAKLIANSKNLGMTQSDAAESLALLLSKVVEDADRLKIRNLSYGLASVHERLHFWQAVIAVIVTSWAEIVEVAIPYARKLDEEEREGKANYQSIMELMTQGEEENAGVNPVDSSSE